MSRSLNDNTEWHLAPIIFKNIAHTFTFVPGLALFASYLNVQIPSNVSRFLDPNGVANDAFRLSWENKKFYAFPPFSLIGAALVKIRRDQSTGIMIIPWWGAQFWFPLMLQLLLDFPNSATTEKEYIVFTIKERVSSSTRSKTKATGGSFITRQSVIGNFHKKLRNLSQTHGEPPQDQDMSLYSNDGNFMHFRRMRIPILPV